MVYHLGPERSTMSEQISASWAEAVSSQSAYCSRISTPHDQGVLQQLCYLNLSPSILGESAVDLHIQCGGHTSISRLR